MAGPSSEFVQAVLLSFDVTADPALRKTAVSQLDALRSAEAVRARHAHLLLLPAAVRERMAAEYLEVRMLQAGTDALKTKHLRRVGHDGVAAKRRVT